MNPSPHKPLYQPQNVLHGFPEKMVILDCETTGGKATRDRITELAMIVVDRGQVVEYWQSLINPQTSIPPWITQITGIHQSMMQQAPSFAELWPEIEQRLTDRVLVAHNARFDYGFIKNEAKRCNASIRLKTLCSVKLSRQLYPHAKKHSLDAIIQRLGCTVKNRHRAMDDSIVVLQLFEQMSLDFDQNTLQAACDRLLKRPSLPSQLDEHAVQDLPDLPGVYYFYNPNQRLLYIGKSVNIKTRVLSHFYQDHQNAVDHHLSHQLHSIDYRVTPSDFGAQILEAQEVKQKSPSLNKRLKKVTQLYQLQTFEQDNYLHIAIKKADTSSSESHNLFGLFRSRRQAQKRLEKLTEDYFLCQKLTGLEKGRSGACFGFQLKKCLGACCQKESAESYNLRVEKALSGLVKQQWPFDGAIIIEEHNPKTQQKAFHLVHQWCYLGTVQNAEELWSWQPLLNEQFEHNQAPEIDNPSHLDLFDSANHSTSQITLLDQNLFDLDIYFILLRFLLSEDTCRKHGLKIHHLKDSLKIRFA